MSSANRNHFTYSFLMCLLFPCFVLYSPDQTSRFSKTAGSRHPHFHVLMRTPGGEQSNDEGGEISTRWCQLESGAHTPVLLLLRDDGVLVKQNRALVVLGPPYHILCLPFVCGKLWSKNKFDQEKRETGKQRKMFKRH